MALTRYQREFFGSQDLERVQDRLEDFLNQLYASDIITGRLLTDVALVSGSATTINHGLGRTPNGVILVKSTVQLDIWQPTEPTRSSVFVQASLNDTVNLWVF